MPQHPQEPPRRDAEGGAAPEPRREGRRGLRLAGRLMVGSAYAAVPFYNWFCRATGFNGTTQVARRRHGAPLARTVAVRFDSNVSGGLPWKFEPEQTEIKVRIGEVATVYYTVTNQSARDHDGAGGL